MINGFTLNGVHCNTYNINMLSVDRTVLPAVNDVYLQVPNRDGSYLFGRELSDRIIKVDCSVFTSALVDLRLSIRQISAWLFTRQRVQLIFDDEQDKYYMAKYDGAIGLNQITTDGEFSLIFRCEPYAYSITPTQTQTVDAVFLFPNYATGVGLGISNLGTAPVFPKFTVTFTAPATEYKLLLVGTNYVRVVRNFIAGDILVIDHSISKITVNGVNAMLNLDLSSRFFAVPLVGAQVTPSPIGVAQILVTFNGRWL